MRLSLTTAIRSVSGRRSILNRKARSSTSSKANLDVFAWKPSDMKGIPREVAEHKVNIKPGSKPVSNAFATSTMRSARR
jgi:hypothetical protein